jgi:hypothetical protein
MRAARFAVARPAVCTLVAMAYDQELAGRIRQLIGSDPELAEWGPLHGPLLLQGDDHIHKAEAGW